MTPHVLVAYATKHGATAEIAESVAEELRRAGLRVRLSPAAAVRDVVPYDAVVLGSAVYVGRWRRDATAFLRRHEGALTGMPLWLFSSGPTGEGDALALTKGWRVPEALEGLLERVRPRDVAVFHGVLDEGSLNRFERWIVARVGAPLGDFRDEDAIAAWSRGIAAALRGDADAGPWAASPAGPQGVGTPVARTGASSSDGSGRHSR